MTKYSKKKFHQCENRYNTKKSNRFGFGLGKAQMIFETKPSQ
jgi:hypothetical protein